MQQHATPAADQQTAPAQTTSGPTSTGRGNTAAP